ncbi:hypothetical protein ACLB1R_24800 [Escherichia coli]
MTLIKKSTLICLTNKNHIIKDIEAWYRNAIPSAQARDWFDSHVAIRNSIVEEQFNRCRNALRDDR